MHRESFQIGQQVIFGTSFLMASFSVFLVLDHVSSSRHLQRMSGLNMAAYWLAHLIWSLTIYLLSCSIAMAVYILSNVQGFTGWKEQGSFQWLFTVVPRAESFFR